MLEGDFVEILRESLRKVWVGFGVPWMCHWVGSVFPTTHGDVNSKGLVLFTSVKSRS